jgi:hypothetical protein
MDRFTLESKRQGKSGNALEYDKFFCRPSCMRQWAQNTYLSQDFQGCLCRGLPYAPTTQVGNFPSAHPVALQFQGYKRRDTYLSVYPKRKDREKDLSIHPCTRKISFESDLALDIGSIIELPRSHLRRFSAWIMYLLSRFLQFAV